MKERKPRGQAPKSLKASGAVGGEGIVVTDLRFKVIALDEGAQTILDDLGRGRRGENAGTLPDEIVEQLNTQSAQGRSHSVQLSTGKSEYSCRTFVAKRVDLTDSTPMLILHLKKEVSVTDAVHQVGISYNLTHRERQALVGVSMGLTSKELAEQMNISPNTVKAFLRLIMIKMGAATRAGVVGKLLEQNGFVGKSPRPDDQEPEE